MAKYNVAHSCGHTREVQLYGPGKDRDRKLQWLETQLCPQCERETLALNRAMESATAAERAKEQGLPPLQGSAKQVAWAETIRKNALADKNNTLPEMRAGGTDEQIEMARGLLMIMGEGLARLRQETSAKWWIDNRDQVNRYVLDIGMKAARQLKDSKKG